MPAPLLFTPITFGDVTLRNRIVVSPMCQYSCEDGFANDWHLVHLGSRAVGGAGAVIMEATAVTAEGRISPGDHGIWKDEHIPMLSRITGFIKAQGAVAGIQLAHAGRKASFSKPWEGDTLIPPSAGGWQNMAPSAVAFHEGDAPPLALSVSQIHDVTQAFVAAAQRAQKAGFQLAEIHAAHGYLINEFLSPLANFREDEYGGSFENRVRILIEVVQAVRKVWPPSLPLWVRISATDWKEGGWTGEDSVRLAMLLKPLGVDLMDCSTGGVVGHVKIPTGPGYQVPYAEQVKQGAGVATGAVGMITEPEQAEAILQKGQADVVLMAREFLRDPYWPLHAAQALGVDMPGPVQYMRAFSKKK